MNFKVFNVNNIKPNYWDFICKKTFIISKFGILRNRIIDSYFVPLWLGNAIQLTLEESKIVLHKAGNWMSYGVYAQTRIESAYLSEFLKNKINPLLETINEKIKMDKKRNENS